MPENSDNIEKIISEITVKDSKTLCREVMSIGDTMDVLRSKWTVEILTAILCGSCSKSSNATATRPASNTA
ncbi:hypothetical protein [Fibrobacter sp. UWH4]|uniref:hypothetical protein n=1 Tax=Fibrobacter sp. UWH4 TaxID=1896210 RepID=UPI0015879AB5|nr:hypothetical protein [Fibrobacter sp. UWH4]